MLVRAATVQDAPAIARIHVETWQAAYAGLIPQDYLDGLRVEQRVPGWRRMLDRTGRPGQGVLVAPAGGDLVGFVGFSPTRDGDRDPTRVGEIGAIYVAAAAWGTGAGRSLMVAALRRLEEAGFESVTLWVLATNHRARRFSQRGGWRPDGTTKSDEARGFRLEEVRYVTALPNRTGEQRGDA